MWWWSGRWMSSLSVVCALVLGVPARQALATGLPDCHARGQVGYVEPQAATAQAVLVFVHGLHGDADATWRHAPMVGASRYWPCLVRRDTEAFRSANVYVAGYTSRPLGSNPGIAESARQIVQELRARMVFHHAQVVLVAHSMGGLVAASMLTQAGLLTAQERDRVRLVMFYASPAIAGEAAAVCAKFLANRQCEEMAEPGGMDALWAAWDQLRPRPAAWCMAEDRDMFFPGMPPWLRIVPAASAHRPCRVPETQTLAEDLNHADLVKPAEPSRKPHWVLASAYAACVRPQLMPSGPAPTAPARSAQALSLGRQWFDQLVAALEQSGAQPEEVLRRQLLAAPASHRHLIAASPADAELRLSEYLRANRSDFALQLRSHPVLLNAQIQWVRTVADAQARLTDQAVVQLLHRAQESTGLLADDVLVALRRPNGDQPGPLYLLVLRAADAQAATPAPSALWIWGLFSTPVLPDGCGA